MKIVYNPMPYVIPLLNKATMKVIIHITAQKQPYKNQNKIDAEMTGCSIVKGVGFIMKGSAPSTNHSDVTSKALSECSVILQRWSKNSIFFFVLKNDIATNATRGKTINSGMTNVYCMISV